MRRIVPLPKQIKSRKHARRVTTEYHRITEGLHQAKSRQEQAKLAAELDALGGVDAYQRASVFNTSLHSTSRWVVKRLRMREFLGHGCDEPRALEIGAINTQLVTTPGLLVRAIDLNSQDPRIEQQDFMQLPHGGELDASTGVSRTYDVLVCSMVLNCVPNARARFDFLVSMRSQLRQGGIAFIVLPRSCLAHSRTLTHDSFIDCLRAIGLPPDLTVPPPESTKLTYFECIASLPDEAAALRYQKVRHEMRSQQDKRRKSRGAEFDVDVGGHLGFGARVARSFEPTVQSRAKQEQRMACEEFLLRQGSIDAGDAFSAGVRQRGWIDTEGTRDASSQRGVFEAAAAAAGSAQQGSIHVGGAATDWPLGLDRSDAADEEHDAKEMMKQSRGSKETPEDLLIDAVARKHVSCAPLPFPCLKPRCLSHTHVYSPTSCLAPAIVASASRVEGSFKAHRYSHHSQPLAFPIIHRWGG
jgi:25S rRNA (adenine2142-N1)-methyltransferase